MAPVDFPSHPVAVLGTGPCACPPGRVGLDGVPEPLSEGARFGVPHSTKNGRACSRSWIFPGLRRRGPPGLLMPTNIGKRVIQSGRTETWGAASVSGSEEALVCLPTTDTAGDPGRSFRRF